MAIILPPPSSGPEQFGIENIILGAVRPALPFENGAVRPDPGSQWYEPLTVAADALRRAARATARVETSDRDLDFIGTAFAVSPTLAAVTGHSARLMLQKKDGPETVYRLNFSSDGSWQDATIDVRVKLIHPYFDFALLEMDRPVGEDSILSFSAKMPEVNERIALIGYPMKDPRNDASSLAAVFGNTFGNKRLMPGCVIAGAMTQKTADEDVPALAHDASCTSGTSGAPIIQLSTGLVVGIHYAGWFLLRNFAVPAWELARDPLIQLSDLRFVGGETTPHWMLSWKDKLIISYVDIEAAQTEELATPDVPPKQSQEQLLTADDIHELHGLLVRADIELKTLFAGLPVELRAELPGGSNDAARLLNCLHDLNHRTELLNYENHTSLYIVLSSAKAVKLTNAALKSALDEYLVILKAKEDDLPQAQGLASVATPPTASFKYVANIIGRVAGKPIEFEGWTNKELKTTIGAIHITFPSAVEGLQMLRGLAVGNSMRSFAIEERSDKFVLRAEENSHDKL